VNVREKLTSSPLFIGSGLLPLFRKSWASSGRDSSGRAGRASSSLPEELFLFLFPSSGRALPLPLPLFRRSSSSRPSLLFSYFRFWIYPLPVSIQSTSCSHLICPINISNFTLIFLLSQNVYTTKLAPH